MGEEWGDAALLRRFAAAVEQKKAQKTTDQLIEGISRSLREAAGVRPLPGDARASLRVRTNQKILVALITLSAQGG